jgi:hypothetical protein
VPHYSTSTFEALPDVALIRLSQIVGPLKKPEHSGGGKTSHAGGAPPPLVPISRSTWWRMVKAGTAPQPIRLSSGITAWRVSEIRAWLEGGAA